MKKGIVLLLLLISPAILAHGERWDEIKDGWSPLMLAIYHNQTEKISKLVRQDVDLNYLSNSPRSHWHLTALEVAIRMDDFANSKLLLDTKKITNPEKLFLTACAQNNAAIIELLIQYGADPNEQLENGYSALIKATNFGSLQVLETLLKHEANPNHAKDGGMTALMFAAYNCELEKAKLLLQYGAQKETTDAKGDTAWDYARKIYLSQDISPQTKAQLIELLRQK